MTRWVVTGARGQLGTHLMRLLADEDPVGVDLPDLDITDRAAVDAFVAEHRPDVLLNAAAYTAVDAAEEHEDVALAVNADGPANLAGALAQSGGRLIHVSTDYVFDGTATEPYEPDDRPAPRTAYGRTKLAGEQAVHAALPQRATVVRTAWVYGGPGPNFVDTMLRLERERDTVDVVADQVGSPTYAPDLAAAMIELARSSVTAPTLHFVNAGVASWHDLAAEAFALAGADRARVRETTSAQFVRPAPRPAWSVLSTRAWTDAGLSAPRPWQEALADCVAAR